jgi:hypothetical protein
VEYLKEENLMITDFEGRPLAVGARVIAWWDGVRYSGTLQQIDPPDPGCVNHRHATVLSDDGTVRTTTTAQRAREPKARPAMNHLTDADPRQPCVFPGCLALFDPRQENADPGDRGGLLTGWQWPAGADAAEDPELPAHDHTT